VYEPAGITMVLVAEESYFTDVHDLIEDRFDLLWA